jgi:hypothetical protein
LAYLIAAITVIASTFTTMFIAFAFWRTATGFGEFVDWRLGRHYWLVFWWLY